MPDSFLSLNTPPQRRHFIPKLLLFLKIILWQFFSPMEILVKNRNFVGNLKFCWKREILFKNRNFCKSKFCWKSIFFKSKFGSKSIFFKSKFCRNSIFLSPNFADNRFFFNRNFAENRFFNQNSGSLFPNFYSFWKLFFFQKPK